MRRESNMSRKDSMMLQRRDRRGRRDIRVLSRPDVLHAVGFSDIEAGHPSLSIFFSAFSAHSAVNPRITPHPKMRLKNLIVRICQYATLIGTRFLGSKFTFLIFPKDER